VTPGASTDVTDARLRAPGHALTVEWSGEHGPESSSTGTCACGRWQESASSQDEVRNEYRFHLRGVLGYVRTDTGRWTLPATPTTQETPA
jgi:hypothetical protein